MGRSWNHGIGWCSIAFGLLIGLVLGLWSFDGPVAPPGWIGDYTSLPRRLIRLGHIALVALGVIHVLLARELPRLALSPGRRRLVARAMSFGNVALPLTLFAAAVLPPVKYLLPLPATSVFLALALTASASLRGGPEEGEHRDGASIDRSSRPPDRVPART